MKIRSYLFAVLSLVGATSAFAGTTHVDADVGSSVAENRPNAISAEILGRGLLYTLNYDRSLNESFAVGAGFSYWSLSSGFSKASVTVVPVYGNFYFSPDSNRGFLTAGVDFLHASVEDRWRYDNDNYLVDHASAFAGIVGGGYEFRGQSGFLFRGTGYVLVASGGALPWIGLTFGATF